MRPDFDGPTLCPKAMSRPFASECTRNKVESHSVVRMKRLRTRSNGPNPCAGVEFEIRCGFDFFGNAWISQITNPLREWQSRVTCFFSQSDRFQLGVYLAEQES